MGPALQEYSLFKRMLNRDERLGFDGEKGVLAKNKLPFKSLPAIRRRTARLNAQDLAEVCDYFLTA